MVEFEFSAAIFKWQANAAWHFIALPSDLSQDITDLYGALKAGWGSIRVQATIGATTWNTSIFPDKSRNAYLLPVKAAVRTAEDLAEGDVVRVALSL